MAGLSVAFDASCEEMWLAWRYGACLVPAPRSLVRSGMELGPWLMANDVTVVSTVPTLVALWPTEALDEVRLLILGGEACPPEIAARLVAPATARSGTPTAPPRRRSSHAPPGSTGDGPVRIGLPAGRLGPRGRRQRGQHRRGEVRAAGHRWGRAGPLPRRASGTRRSTRRCPRWAGSALTAAATWSATTEGLLFLGRADDQVKIGGRRIELGEIDAVLLALPGVTVRRLRSARTGSGNAVLVGYLTLDGGQAPQWM